MRIVRYCRPVLSSLSPFLSPTHSSSFIALPHREKGKNVALPSLYYYVHDGLPC